MLPLYNGGHRAALEVVGDELYALHDEGKVRIPDAIDGTNYMDYIRAVAKVAPDNIDVQTRLIDDLRERGQEAEAISVLERLFERSEFVPLRFRELLGSLYELRGEHDRAQKHYIQYIRGLNQMVEANPQNVNLANLLARFCAEKRLELDLALEKIHSAVEIAPDNVSLTITVARVHVARGDYEDSLEQLAGIPQKEGLEYELHYVTGLTYLGLNDATKARTEFESALALNPESSEVKERLSELNGHP
jgi:tetratricopeptide (TPR) repeat protein